MKKVFVLGNPRSGTSLFRLMLNANPLVVAPPESGFLHWWSNKYNGWQWDQESQWKLDEFIKDISISKKIETWHLNYDELTKFIIGRKPNSYSSLAELIYLFYAHSIGKEPLVIADKNNYYIHHLDELKAIWPDACYIQLVRDGRDVACSYMEMKSISTDSIYKPNLTDDVREIAREWSENNKKINDFILVQPGSKGKVIRYEDIIVNSEDTLRDVCSFLDISYTSEMLNYHAQRNHDEPAETMAWKKKTLDPPDKDRMGRYKTLLKEADVDAFNSIAEGVLRQFNYSIP